MYSWEELEFALYVGSYACATILKTELKTGGLIQPEGFHSATKIIMSRTFAFVCLFPSTCEASHPNVWALNRDSACSHRHPYISFSVIKSAKNDCQASSLRSARADSTKIKDLGRVGARNSGILLSPDEGFRTMLQEQTNPLSFSPFLKGFENERASRKCEHGQSFSYCPAASTNQLVDCITHVRMMAHDLRAFHAR